MGVRTEGRALRAVALEEFPSSDIRIASRRSGGLDRWSPRQRKREAEELDSILPWGLGSFVETFANTLDDIIGEAMEEWNRTPEKNDERRERHARRALEGDWDERGSDRDERGGDWDERGSDWDERGSDRDERGSDWDEQDQPCTSSATGWNMSWNGVFGADAEVEDGVDAAVGSTAVPVPEQQSQHQLLRKELRRYKKQNETMKKKVASLQAELERLRLREDVPVGTPTADEHVTLRVQIEHLLAQKNKMRCENDLLKRENKLLEERLDYFLGGIAASGEDDFEVGSTSAGLAPSV